MHVKLKRSMSSTKFIFQNFECLNFPPKKIVQKFAAAGFTLPAGAPSRSITDDPACKGQRSEVLRRTD